MFSRPSHPSLHPSLHPRLLPRIDTLENTLDGLVSQVASLNKTVMAIAGLTGGVPLSDVDTNASEEKKDADQETAPDHDTASAVPAATANDTANAMTSLQSISLQKEISDLAIQTAALRKEMKQRDDNARLNVESKFSELEMQNRRLHTRLQAEFPGIEEFKQFKLFTAERAKKQKMSMQQKTVDIQRSMDEKFNVELEKVFKWKDTFDKTTSDRMKSVEDLVRGFSEDLTYLRGGVDEHVHMLEERIQENQQWSQKKFGER